jgi:hypothetical protein
MRPGVDIDMYSTITGGGLRTRPSPKATFPLGRARCRHFVETHFQEHSLVQVYIVTHPSRLQIAPLSLIWSQYHVRFDHSSSRDREMSASCPVQVYFSAEQPPICSQISVRFPTT